MKKFGFIFLILIYIVSACSPTKTEVEVTPTITNLPTVIYTPTPNITPLSKIPTFIPTFDISEIVTVTPAEKAECPIPNGLLEIELPQLNSLSPESLEPWLVLDQKILQFLNQGGQIQNLTLSYEKNDIFSYYGGFLPMSLDLTGDFVNEIVVFNPIYNATKISPAIFIFGCNGGEFAILFIFQQPKSSERFQNLLVKDMNSNNLPELIFQLGHADPENSFRIWVYEYRNNTFESLLLIPYDSLNNVLFYNTDLPNQEQIIYRDYLIALGEHNFVIHNEDNNPFEEIILERRIDFSNAPTRFVKIIYAWNGFSFSFYESSYTVLE